MGSSMRCLDIRASRKNIYIEDALSSFDALMDVLPVELISLISSFACTDGGYTGASLSATSTQVRAIVQPYALQTIALHSWPQIVALSRFLQARNTAQTPPYLRPRCYHLYMTDRIHTHPSRVHQDKLLHSNRDGLDEPTQKVVPGTSTFAEHAYSILAILGSHLLTLTLRLFDEHHASLTTRTNLELSFPALEELTIHSSFLRTLADNASPMSRLRRLHIIQNVAFDYHFVSVVSTLAPALVHLRLSELSTAVYHTGDLLHRGIASLAGVPDEGGFPETLEKLVMQFRNENAEGLCAEGLSSTPVSAEWPLGPYAN